MDLSWDIVVWTKEDTIDYIPSSWANEGKTKYKYPTKNSSFKIKKIIDLCSPLDDDFQWLEASCKAESVKDLQLAKDMCDRGQFTSNLEITTDAERHSSRMSSKKRKIKKNRYFINSSSSESEDDVQKAKNKKQSSTFVRDTFETPTPPRLTTQVYQGNMKHNNNSRMSERSSEGGCQGYLNICDTVVNHGTPTSRAIGLGNESRFKTHERENTRGLNVLSNHNVTLKTTAARNNDCATMKELFEIKLGILENRKIMERLEAKLSGSNHLFIDIEETIKLPCETQEEMDALEAEIQSNKNMKDLISNLYLVGGSTPHKTVYLILNKIFGRNLALMYSGQGKKKKSSFCDLKVCEAVKAATRKRHPNVSDEEIKKSIGLFLSTAKSRLPKTASGNEQNVQVVEEVNIQEDIDALY